MKRFLPAVFLSALVIAVYGQTATFPFIQFDDPQLIVDNSDICCGMTADRLRWVWGEAWQESVFFIRPLALTSHLIDGAMFGRQAAGHHLINIGWHLGCVLVLLAWLTNMTGAKWRSLAVAALFAVHPWNADVVAWVSQRATLLSGFFFLTALLAYQRYIQKPELRGFAIVFLFFLAAVMAKPSAVMLPLILLLVDWLGGERVTHLRGRAGVGVIVLEKIPFLVISAGTGCLIVLVSRASGAAVSQEAVPLSLRAANALVSLGIYLVKTVVPTGLCVYYPFPRTIPWWPLIITSFFLIGISALLIHRRHQAPLALFGWLWFLMTLLPGLGLFQAGPWPARADHYMYVPLMGLLVSLVCLIPDRLNKASVTGIMVLLMIYGIMGFRQAGFYRDNQTLFSRALAVTDNNFLAHTGLGNVRMAQGRLAEAEKQFRRALVIKPDIAGAYLNLGLVLARSGRPEAAADYYRQALALNPQLVEAHVNLANLLASQGHDRRAINHYLAALAVNSNLAEANYNLGRIFAARGDFLRARRYLTAALASRPSDDRYRRAWDRVNAP